MTRAAIRNEIIAAAAFAVVRRLPAVTDEHGNKLREFTSGDVTVLLAVMTPTLGGGVSLDVWLEGAGKVAAFWLSSDFADVETVTIKPRTLPRWLPVLEFEANAARVNAGTADHS